LKIFLSGTFLIDSNRKKKLIDLLVLTILDSNIGEPQGIF